MSGQNNLKVGGNINLHDMLKNLGFNILSKYLIKEKIEFIRKVAILNLENG